MIENRQLYSFEEENDSDLANAPENEMETEALETGPPKFMYQTVVAVLCLLITILLCRQPQGWAYWLRERLHYAINTSSEASFGRLWNTAFFQSIVRNGNNLIRLEKVTETLSGQNAVNEDSGVFKNSVWPVSGNIIREYGWGYNRNTRISEFTPGVIFKTTGKTAVKAIAAGEVIRISQKEDGWLVEIDHGAGWSSVYRPLSEVDVRVSQPIGSGQIIGRTGLFENAGSTNFSLEVRHYGQSVDPRLVIR